MALNLVCQEREVKQNLKLEEKDRILVFHLTRLLLKHVVGSAFALCPPWPYKAGLHPAPGAQAKWLRGRATVLSLSFRQSCFILNLARTLEQHQEKQLLANRLMDQDFKSMVSSSVINATQIKATVLRLGVRGLRFSLG